MRCGREPGNGATARRPRAAPPPRARGQPAFRRSPRRRAPASRRARPPRSATSRWRWATESDDGEIVEIGAALASARSCRLGQGVQPTWLQIQTCVSSSSSIAQRFPVGGIAGRRHQVIVQHGGVARAAQPLRRRDGCGRRSHLGHGHARRVMTMRWPVRSTRSRTTRQVALNSEIGMVVMAGVYHGQRSWSTESAESGSLLPAL
jgi:hypothetical protein